MQRLGLFGNIFAPPNISGLGQFVLKFWAKIEGALEDRAS